MSWPSVLGFGPEMQKSAGAAGYVPQGASLSITTQPVTTNSATAMAGVVVKVLDQQGDVDTGDSETVITVSLNTDPPTGSTLGGTLSKTVSAGVATFSDLEIDKNGVGFKLGFAATTKNNDSLSAVSDAFNIRHVLAFTTQPTDGDAEDSAMTAFAVTVRDGDGSTVTSDTSNITLTLATNPGGSTIAGTNPQAAVAGVATFNDIVLDEPAAGYSFTAAGPDASYVSTTSDTFEIIVGWAGTLAEGTSGLLFRDQFDRSDAAIVGGDPAWSENDASFEISTNRLYDSQATWSNVECYQDASGMIATRYGFALQSNVMFEVNGNFVGIGAFSGHGDDSSLYVGFSNVNHMELTRRVSGSAISQDFDATLTGVAGTWYTVRMTVTQNGSNVDLRGLAFKGLAASSELTNALTQYTSLSNMAYPSATDLFGPVKYRGAYWDEVILMGNANGGAIVVTGLQAGSGQKIKFDSNTAVAEVGGTVTIPMSTWETWAFPCTTIYLLNSSDVELDSDSPAGGLWGGHTYTVS